MFRWFRSGNPFTVLFLLAYAVVVKSPYLLHLLPPEGGAAAYRSPGDGYLYPYLLDWLQRGLGPGGFALLAFVLLFLQAWMLNGTVNRFRLLPGSSFFPAFCFLLFSSFFPAWNTFSSALVANLLVLCILPLLFQGYATQHPRGNAFNTGLLAGLASLLYFPAFLLCALLWGALLVNRPFRLAEWLLVLFGFLCPYYFLGAALFLTDHWSLGLMPWSGFSYPVLLHRGGYAVLGGLVWVIGWFLFGSLRLQPLYMKMLIQARKCWTVLLAMVCVTLAFPFFSDTFSLAGWLPAFLPMAAFIAIGFWHIRREWLALTIHLLSLAFVFLHGWGIL